MLRGRVEKALEAHTRQLRLDSALNAITAALGIAMSQRPEILVQQVLEALGGLGASHPTLRAALVTGFGALRRNPEAIAMALPVLYSSMTDPHQEVRAATAWPASSSRSFASSLRVECRPRASRGVGVATAP